MTEDANYTTSFVVNKSAEEVFAAVCRPQTWWSEDIIGRTDRQGELFYYHYKDIHRATFRLAELVPGRKVVWHVLQNYFNFIADTTEWTGTDIVFEVSPTSEGTELRFTHVGLRPSGECYEVCHDSWKFYLESSLKNLLTSGQGSPNKGEDNVNPTVVPQAETSPAA